MMRTWNVSITAQDDGGWMVVCSPEAFGGGGLIGRPFGEAADLKGFLLAVRVREEEVTKALQAIADAGRVQVLYGSSTGLSLNTGQLWDQNTTGVPDAAEAGDGFGRLY